MVIRYWFFSAMLSPICKPFRYQKPRGSDSEKYNKHLPYGPDIALLKTEDEMKKLSIALCRTLDYNSSDHMMLAAVSTGWYGKSKKRDRPKTLQQVFFNTSEIGGHEEYELWVNGIIHSGENVHCGNKRGVVLKIKVWIGWTLHCA